ncbi:unnamed protein product [[Actinomadura] parvosata subsp. kistnae]|uniref:DUF3168 domain-containing protein n=1 Tax=[Actinomadura] parvosata subsp. kistnae TaxID=1909395 RepID=A0A1V0ABR7_9ACTN|nr:hypothetical protein [Nonomuraea sp. ATCC 55076]AQZ67636.1 hypothetical protein BKM31_44765 [Nonomuraea sp. ATCC 55076]SPL94077.1 unnamed protein product [Actinomadura parvosata subsp. kistnae]
MSTIPAVLDALVALAERAWPHVQVLDGGPTTNVERDVIEIGYSGSPTEPDVRSTMTREQLDMQPDMERYDVMCLVSSWRGDAHRGGRPDARTTRERAFELLTGFRSELAKDSRLGGLVMMATMSTLDMVADQTDDGPVCTVRFVVHVDAFADA